jgi:hypothetical protein
MSNKTQFITNDDISELSSHNIDINDIDIFLQEIMEYFNRTWDPQYHITKKYTDIELFNKEILDGYPSTSGYYILESSFTGSCPVHLLSVKSKGILGYLYGIYLR